MIGHLGDFLAQPWRGAENMSALDFGLLVGLILAMLLFWGVVLSHLKEALEG